MLLKVGVVMIIFSLTLAAGIAAAVVGFRGETTETGPVSPAKPQDTETTQKQKKFNPGEKLEIDDGSGKNPLPELRPKSVPPVASVPDWPQPTSDEVAVADEPRYFNPGPDTDMTLTIEALGLYDVPVITSDSLDVLDNGLIHVPETSFPWDGGAQRNVYIAGHYLGWPGTASRLVFYNLDKLKSRDEAVLKDSLGRVYRYRVSESFTADPDESWVMGQELNRDMLTLQTCIPPSFEKRLIVRADRI